jgi:integrase
MFHGGADERRNPYRFEAGISATGQKGVRLQGPLPGLQRQADIRDVHHAKAAQTFRNKIRRQRDEGLVIDAKAGMISVAEYAATWLERTRVKRKTTYSIYETHLRLHILPMLGGRQLRAVSRTDIQAFINKIHAGGLAPRTVHAVYVTVAAVFRSAHLLDKRLTASPCVEITLPEIPDREVEVLSVAAVRAFAAGMPARYRAAVLVAAGTGLRVSEVMGLTWDRIDLDARTVKVDRQMTPRSIFGPPEARRSKRVVLMPEMVAEALATHRADFPRPARTSRTPTAQPCAGPNWCSSAPTPNPATPATLGAGSNSHGRERASPNRSPSTPCATPTPPSRSRQEPP